MVKQRSFMDIVKMKYTDIIGTNTNWHELKLHSTTVSILNEELEEDGCKRITSEEREYIDKINKLVKKSNNNLKEIENYSEQIDKLLDKIRRRSNKII